MRQNLYRRRATQVVKNIRRATRRHFKIKIRIVWEGLRGGDSIAEFLAALTIWSALASHRAWPS